MRRVPVCIAPVVCLIFSLPTAAQEGQGAPSTISGRVLNSLTGEPVARALVKWSPVESGRSGKRNDVRGQVLTDVSGSFETPQLAAGAYILEAARPQFSSSRQMITIGKRLERMELKLAPLGAI